MDRPICDAVRRVLRCPACGGPLCEDERSLACGPCGLHYGCTPSGSLDLRLQAPKVVRDEYVVGTPLLPPSGFEFAPMRPNPRPEVDFSGVETPFHLTAELMSYFPRARTPDSLMLDLGCGTTIHRAVCERAGFQYVGLDYDTPEAPLQGDAHALPFADASFEFVLAVAVLEHLRFPFVVMREAFRVLRPGGVLAGSVAFLEPFHADSFYHHTHLGTYSALCHGGFEVLQVCPSDTWRVLDAHADMAFFPKMPRPLSVSLVAPLKAAHWLWWRLGRVVNPKATEENRRIATTGAQAFVARRPAA
ncbi:MAG: class I SAM-dependent methyltransferase [Candidatus Latescibacterota bacterium]